ncbi:unnamed protein product [Linum tenue]|uniref:Uncharacterized protein n=1 Tax=Linum tenue TaxID=586396 RepID=A0AAV0Q6D8_9ROSI|nr:unnamed protein product [Linum tenue]
MMKNMFSNEESVLQFNKGLEEAQKFLPVPNTLLVDLETNSQNVNSIKKVRGKMKSMYHKDFVLDQDGNWMLQGWKGRIIYASSCWVPA